MILILIAECELQKPVGGGDIRNLAGLAASKKFNGYDEREMGPYNQTREAALSPNQPTPQSITR